MTPEQIDHQLTRLEAIPAELEAQLAEVAADETLSPAGRDARRSELSDALSDEIDQLEAELSAAIAARLDQLRAEIDHERRSFFEPDAPADADPDAALAAAATGIEGLLRRADLRARWHSMSGREILAHYQQTLADGDRPIIEMIEFEGPRLLSERGDGEGETALRAAISQARDLRTSERSTALQAALERAEVMRLRLANALEVARGILGSA